MFSRPRVRPQAWHPSPAPRGPHPRQLPELRLLRVPGVGPEDVLFDGDRILTGLADGRVLSIAPDGRRIDIVADTSGRPLGLEAHPDGRIVVCDTQRGLLLLDPRSGAIQTLVARGVHDVRVCNNAAVAGDGTIYFSDSSQRFEVEQFKADILEHSGTGRLLRRDPDGVVSVLLSGLQFANGVALAPDESFVVVAATGSYELTRLWLTGPRTGQVELFGDVLPGFPDNLSVDAEGLFWVAMAGARKALVDATAALPWLRTAVWALPTALHPKPDDTIWIRALDQAGSVVLDVCGKDPQFPMSTGVRRHGDSLALGTLTGSGVGVVDLSGLL